jgi:hypothetical protein
MTVKELIERLSQYSEDEEVLIQDSNEFTYFIDSAIEEYYDYKDKNAIYLIAGQLA